MVSKENKRVYVTVSKNTYDYLDRIVKIYNKELGKLKNRRLERYYKLSVSKLYYMAIGNLIFQIDSNLDANLSRQENYKRIFNFLCPSWVDNKKA